MAVTPSNSSLLTPDDTEENQLTISRIDDPNGVSIVNRITYQTSFKLNGINAERNSSVWIMYGNEKLGEATSNNAGEWVTPLLDAPKFDCYNVFAEGRWADNPVSPPRRFTVATETPIINAVLSDGKPITDGDTIRETSVTINCNARPNQNAEVLNGDTSLKSEPASACGICTFKLEDLDPGAYNITVKGTNGKVSTPFKFTVIEDVITPATLDKVTDLVGTEIPKNTTTSETSLYVEGEGKKGEKVEIFNGLTSLGEAPVDATTGRFKHRIGPLDDAAYNLTAVANWADGGTSDPYPFTVAAIKLATLDKVTTLVGTEIPKNTTTSETSLYVEGEGKKGEKVEIFNGLATLGEAPVEAATGRFKYEIGPLADDDYNLTAVAKWPDGGTSDPYPFTVEAATIAPTETRIYDVDGNVIANGGDINRSWFIARGLHTPNSAVKIKLNGVIQPNPESTNGEGKWAFFNGNLTDGTTYEISALTLDEKAESNKWSVVARPLS